MKVLILGGYGTFGGHLAQLLANEVRLALIIGGRSLERAQTFCDRLAPGASRTALYFNRDGDVLAQIRAIGPDLVVDATGPFQCYGADPYRIIKACLVREIDYLDLADGAEFVKGVAQFDGAARALGVFVLSGVSSFPVLSAAVVRHLARDLAGVDSIVGGIAPSPYAGVGVNVIRAITSFSGKRLALVRDGEPSFGVAMTESLRYTVSLPIQLREMHQFPRRQIVAGRADVQRGRHPLARLIAFVVGFPAPGRQVPVQVEFCRADSNEERWTRTFASRSFSSLQSAGRGRETHLLRERFGLLTFCLALVVDGSTLRLVVRRWSLCGLPLPLFLAPGGDAYETVVDGRFYFHVEIRQRLIGLIVSYRGWLQSPYESNAK
jgi:uncharacterized protein DUF4166/saccharopine dehydrogenase-like protein